MCALEYYYLGPINPYVLPKNPPITLLKGPYYLGPWTLREGVLILFDVTGQITPQASCSTTVMGSEETTYPEAKSM